MGQLIQTSLAGRLHPAGKPAGLCWQASGPEGACQPARKTMQAHACGGRTRAALRAAPRPFPPLTTIAYTYSCYPFLSEYIDVRI
ncbi:hypothetical protein EG201_21025 [Salmonella enterica]|uniref:Uncharacterized protein n=1 Tax=Salmonella enterica subsp. enterica serovar Javiana TaxID=363569 RepID=A0A607KAF5_SALET|nr:hypothetical protein [Salmonella enterica]ECK8646739.1 hypothetical protein [Salmonella enterica subsp. enterica serovar Javiana]EAO8299781.1 hypothetical protein [Salmonella enterica]EAO8413571.1 hypothetical protein [Salmonella enterica]EAS6426786.1 hypothetical protein [Salmonella enterica]